MHMPEDGFLLPNRAAHPQRRVAPAAAASECARDEREDMSLIDDLVKLEEEAKELVAGADDAAKLEAARVELLGRKGRITGLMRMMGKLAPEDRPVMGKRANEMRQLVEGLFEERKAEIKAAALKHALEHDAVDITLPGIRPQIGHQHLIKQIINQTHVFPFVSRAPRSPGRLPPPGVVNTRPGSVTKNRPRACALPKDG